MAVVEELERHTVRLQAAFASTNQNPLGACAITGTGFPIDRHRTSALLGFSGPTGNTYGSIATVDYLLESTAAAVNVLVGCGRFVQDMLLWSTTEMGYLRLPDGFVQSSSIMPQKRNPVALEHARSLLSRAFGQMLAIPQAVHNTPFGDIVDTEDDLQPLVAAAFGDATRGVSLVAAAMAGAEFHADRMALRAATTWVTITELADTLARDHGVPFAAAHRLAGDVIRRSGGDIARAGAAFADAVQAAGYDIAWSPAHLARILSPAHFVAVRETVGGPGPGAMAAALAAASAALIRDRAGHAACEQGIRAAAAARAAALAAL
jgi:argininosuccinate lyase